MPGRTEGGLLLSPVLSTRVATLESLEVGHDPWHTADPEVRIVATILDHVGLALYSS